MEEERKKLEKLYQELNEEDNVIKKWNQALIPKAILLFPFFAQAGFPESENGYDLKKIEESFRLPCDEIGNDDCIVRALGVYLEAHAELGTDFSVGLFFVTLGDKVIEAMNGTGVPYKIFKTKFGYSRV